MDRSTQVNIISSQQHRKMKRHNTSADLNLSVKGANLQNTWGPHQRPKSLNLSSEMFQKSKLVYSSESPIRLNYLSQPTFSELVLNQANVREKCLPFSAVNNYVKEKPSHKNKLHNLHDTDGSTSTSSLKGCCRCWDIESGTGNYKKTMLSSTPEGLSWRRLHMSRAKLKATATTSELLSGFAMVAMVELQINEPTNVPEWLFVIFAVCTTVLVAVHIFALMISTYILPNIDAIAKLEICEMVAESPHERMRGFIELAWAFSTVLGLFLFLVEVAILCWVKFWDYSFTAAIAATVIVIPVLITFILFAVHFYHSLVVHRCDTSINDMETLEHMKKRLDQVSSPA